MTSFTFRYGRRFRTGQYETAEISLEEQFDDEIIDKLQAHDILRSAVDALVEHDKEDYARESAEHPERKR
jgi:hypothetical protein